MRRCTDISVGRRDYVAPAGRRRCSETSPATLIDRLQELGFEVAPLWGTGNNVAGGVPLQLAVRKLLQSGPGSGVAGKSIRPLLREDLPFTLSLSDLGHGEAAILAMQRLCEFLQSEMADARCDGGQVGICIQSRQMPLHAFQLVTKSVAGPRYVILDDPPLTTEDNRQSQSESDGNWAVLWRNRLSSRPLKPVYGDIVRTGCPLLADEIAASVLPVRGIQVPADSAWLPLTLPLPRFTDDTGEIRWGRLLRALTGGVGLADKLMDRLHWPHAGQLADARLNRRLAISITGLGDLVMRRGLNPRDLDALHWLSAIVIRVRKVLWQHSGTLARRYGYLPALHRTDSSCGWNDRVQREKWLRRWRAALQKSAVRHRNMLIISPYSLFPSVGSFDAAYTDLLPVIACADAWSFADVPNACSWNLSEFKTFHRRTWAVIQGCKTGTFVAAGV